MSIKDNFPSVGPSLSLNFARSKTLDPRITFSRTNPTATYMNGNGLIVTAAADEPRFDHKIENGVVKSLGLLVEEQRTNLLPHSVVSSTNWTDFLSTVTDNDATAPDGTNTAARIQVYSPGSSGGYVTKQSIGVTTGTEYTFSFYVKSQSGSSGTWGINIYDHGGGGFHNRTDVDITGEWTRVSYSYTPTSGTINVYVSDDRDNTATISDAYVWGAQLEAGSFPTSYIPTSGSQATRSPDNVSMEGTNFSDWYNQDEGTIYCSFKNTTTDFEDRKNVYSIYGDNSVGIELRSPNNDFNRLRYVYNGNFNSSPTQFQSTLNQRKSAFSYNQTEHKGCLDGELSNNTEGHTNDDTKNALYIGTRVDGADHFNGYISQLTYYPKRLTNTQLQNLTK